VVGGDEARLSSEDPRRPGTGTRVLLFVAALSGYALALSVAFPLGAPDRLPVLALSFLLALAGAQRWARGARLFAFLLPCAGGIARLAGGTDPAAWPTLLFAGFAAGWTFRFLYDFDTRPDASGPDGAVRALLGLWTLSALFAVVEASTLWALFHGLSGRTVNGEGLPESTAIRESLLSFGALAGGGAFFLLLRRSGEAMRRQALSWALYGTAVSAAVAILQRFSILPGERHPFWRMTGRLSGGAVDPNSFGLLCAMALVVALAVASRGSGRRLPAVVGAVLFAAGLLLSGSRSGLLLAAISLLILLLRQPRRFRSMRAFGLAAAAALAIILLSATPGTVGSRLLGSFDPSVPVAYRASARPMLWGAAWRLFLRHPVQGGGMGVYMWRLPDLLREQGLAMPTRDNPGSAYVQALAETGIVGLAFTLLFAVVLARDGVRRLTRGAPEGNGVASASALAALAFLGVSAVGSHWLAADAGLFFFLIASIAALPSETAPSRRARLWLRAGLLIYAGAAFVMMLSTARPEETFRYGSLVGFYPPERGPGGQFQWTRRNFALWLAPGERRRLGLANFSPIGLPVEITARSGDWLLYWRSLQPGGAMVLDLEGASSGAAPIRFALSRSFVPRRLGIPGGDARQLGLQAVFFGR
jgi:O-antigen ligase